jgi:hypothetical protein
MSDERLSEYVSAQALGAAPERLSPELRAAANQAWREDREELLALVEAAFGGGVPPASAPAPDLSFLRRGQRSMNETLGQKVIQFSDALIASLRPQALVGATRGQLVLRYVQDPTTTAELGVTIEVYAEDTARTVGRVRVGVDLPGRDPLDMAGSQVVLRADGAEWRSETDETGGVDFTPVPLTALPNLRVEIMPPDQST